MTRRISVPFLFTAALVAYGCAQGNAPTSPQSAAATSLAVQAGKATICHKAGDSYHVLSVPPSAEAAHRAHGDAAPGEAVPGDPYLRFTSSCGAAATFDLVGDYDAGWLSGSNPNGVWRYGWSSSLTSPLHLYTQNYTTTQDCPSSVYRAWNDPANNLGFTPAVIKNTGPDCPAPNIPAGAVTQHHGGLSGTDYSHIVFTAPFAGTYTVTITFTGRQSDVHSDVHVLLNGTPVLSDLLTSELQTAVYSAALTLTSGATLDLAAGPGTIAGLHGGHVGMSGTITGVQ